MRRFTLLLALGLLATPLVPAQERPAEGALPYYAKVSSVGKVYGGAGDRFWAFRDLAPGEVVRVLEVEGDWLRIAPPGDLSVVVARRLGGRDLVVDQPDTAEWLVQADDLQLRGRVPPEGDPNRDYPPLGELQAGDRVVVLEQLGEDWLRIAAPPHTEAWVLAGNVSAGARDALEPAFRESWLSARKELVRSAPVSGDRLARNEAAREAAARAEALFARFDAIRARPASERDLEGLSEEIEETIAALPEDDPRRARAEALETELAAWVARKAELAAVREKLDAAAKEAEEAERRYAERLAAARRRLEQGGEAPEKEELHTGWVRKTPKIRGLSKPGPDWYLEFGGRRRALLESERYDLEDFEGVLVKVLATDGKPRRRPGDTEDTLRVTRFEILETPRNR